MYENLFYRFHEFYTKNQKDWRRNLTAYSGSAEYLDVALIKHLSEPLEEFQERSRRAYYINYPRKVARLITQYVLATKPERKDADAKIVEDFNRNRLRVDEVMRQFSTMLNVFGCAWLLVDMPKFDGDKTKEQELKEKIRPYCVALNPLQVVDWSYGADGELLWVLIAEVVIDNSDYMSTPGRIEIRKLYTQNEIITITKDKQNKITESVTEHNLGLVPFIRYEEVDGFGLGAKHWFNDVVRISDAILNNESEAQMNVVKQMFGLLVISESFADSSRKVKDASTSTSNSVSSIIARSAAIVETPEERGISRYISPNGVENATIRTENVTLKKELFEVVGLSTSNDTKMVESAEAKAWDFQNIQHFMCSRADMLEQAEYRAWEIMNLWNNSIALPTIRYNRQFAIMDFRDSVASLLDLSTFNNSSELYQKEIGKTAVSLLGKLRQLSQEEESALLKEVSSLKNLVVEQNPMSNEFDIDK